MRTGSWRAALAAALFALVAVPSAGLLAQAVPSMLPEPQSAAGKALLADWRAAFAKAREAHASAPHGTVVEELARRVELEQAGRRAFMITTKADLPRDERSRVNAGIWSELNAVDEDNLRWLKTVLPADGWFRNSREGKAATKQAWLIVQHASDRAFQKQVLAAMEPLVAQGEVNGADYALLYDRLEMYEGRPQRYGSQVGCENGVWAVYRLEDPGRVNELRRQVGLSSLQENNERLGVGRAC
ncbi:DUF6624 domain-containing protein [Phenylobacterium deserti]|uniref:Uncharacterized protein n=1 Tax=Phenylobacterium deserti TaxID=1914756 RepID=A0A328A8K1_9CAUL|nr:DUF6624 domain-containing protein [Phenylobacterium deserti]RAK50932.1 hypothetical protein DJ018_17355 [Phenylobacterium deserti]